MPPAAHLHALISMLPTLGRPTIIILDAFDLFALHPRQSLLYCLLDTVQGCRTGSESKGLAVLGVTTRVDTINLLEKRVKSRFSGRLLRTAAPRRVQDWVSLSQGALSVPLEDSDIEEEEKEEWNELWNSAVQDFLDDERTLQVLKETFSVTRDVRMLTRILVRSLHHHVVR